MVLALNMPLYGEKMVTERNKTRIQNLLILLILMFMAYGDWWCHSRGDRMRIREENISFEILKF